MEVKDIADAALTVLIGFYCLLSVEGILYVCNFPRLGFFEKSASTVGDNLTFDKGVVGVLFLLVSFATGIIVEDLSYNLVDDSKPLPGALKTVLLPVLGPLFGYDSLRTLLRVQVLLDYPQFGRELAQINLFTELEADRGSLVDRWFAADPCVLLDSPPQMMTDARSVRTCKQVFVLTASELDAAIARVYYTGKNWSYAQATYFNELQRIQSRLDFVRTLALTSLFLLAGYLLALVYCAITRPLSKFGRHYRRDASGHAWPRCYRAMLLALRKQGRTVHYRRKWYRPFIFAIVVYILAIGFGLFAYRHESNEFAKRAIGYFATSRRLDKVVTH